VGWVVVKDIVLAILRRLRTRMVLFKSSSISMCGDDVHIGKGTVLWAPIDITIGNGVYIGKNVTIECNAAIGNYVLIANNVSFVGKNDHDFKVLGIPVRFSPWIGGEKNSIHLNDRLVVESDVWIGFGAIVLSGVRIGRGAVVAAGSVVTKNIDPYSIVAGNPARVIAQRYTQESRREHEYSVENGKFISSERGYRYWVVKPAKMGVLND
jgi:acetyltransferase-like isoleucine patch superfamily enzyme